MAYDVYSEGLTEKQAELKDVWDKILKQILSKAAKAKEKALKTPTNSTTNSDDPDAPKKKKQRRNTKGSDGKPIPGEDPTTPYKGSQ